MMRRNSVLVYLVIALGLLTVTLCLAPVVADSSPYLHRETPGSPSGWFRGVDQVVPTIPVTVTATAYPSPTPTQTATPRPIVVRFEGVITAVPSSLYGEWRIDDTPVSVTSETIIALPEPGHVPHVGDYAIVNAVLEGSVRKATRIRISAIGSIEFLGVITSFPPAPYLGTWVVAGVRVNVTDGRALPGTPPVMGYYAQIKGWLQPNRQVLAENISILNPTDLTQAFEFEGIVEERPITKEGVWVIAGVRGMVTSSTVIPVDPTAVGATVVAKGRRLPGGTLIFQSILALSPQDREVRLAGLIEDMQPDYWVVGSTEVDVDSATFIDESQARAAKGMWAEVVARRSVGGILLALRIRVERPD
jgi:hypothetical protein